MQFDLLMGGALAVGSIALADSEHRDTVLAGAKVGAGLLGRKYGRDDEREADHYGILYMQRAGYDPREAVALQETFVRLAEDGESSWLEGLFASHPPSRERVDNNRRSVAELNNAAGEIGRERYQRNLARLVRTRPAYEAYDEAVAAWEED